MKYSSAILVLLALLAVSCKKKTVVIWQGVTYEYVSNSETPFPMTDVEVPIFPDRTFTITDYGARPMPEGGYPTAADSSRIIRTNSKAFELAMRACSASGGGHVVVPNGEWLTGTVLFDSNCDLYLSDGAEIVFSANPDDFLPEHMTTYEGVECYNYRPLIYAWRLTNVGISGTGTIRPLMSEWEKWYEPTPDYYKALQILDRWGTFNHRFYERNISSRSFRLRPPLIQFYQCNHIVLQNFKIRESPHWAIHVFGCEEGIARNLDIVAMGRNNDGIAIEMTRHFVVEDCSFDQGGDAVSVKSGRVYETWNTPESSRYIVVRGCTANRCKALLSIGEEISHGIHNVYMHDCKTTGEVNDLLSIRSNKRQRASVDSIMVENCEAATLQRVFAIDTDVWGDWREVSSSGKDSIATISGISMRDIKCRRAVALIDINGDKRMPARGISVRGIHADSVSSYVTHTENVEGFESSDIHYNWIGNSTRQPIRPK